MGLLLSIVFLLLLPDDLGSLGRFQHLPVANDVLLLEKGDNALRDLFEVARRERENRRTGSRQAHSEQPRLRGRCHRLHDLGQAGNQRLAVWLMQLILHGEVDQLWVGRRLAECHRQECYPLEIEGLRQAGRQSVTISSVMMSGPAGMHLPRPDEDTTTATPREPWPWVPRTPG